MDTKILLTGIISFIAGALLVSVVATTMEKPQENTQDMHHMAEGLKGKTGDEFDKAFLSQMIMHHSDAMVMAKMAENQAGHIEIKNLSKNMVSTQEKEINEMRNWQQAWGFKTDHMPMN